MFLGARAGNFLQDENGGERDTLTTLLILSLIIIPLVLVIILFGNKIVEYAKEKWDNVMSSPVKQ